MNQHLFRNLNSKKFIGLILILFFSMMIGKAQCDQNYDWASWDDFTGQDAIGTIDNNGQSISVSMSANYNFNSTNSIFGFGNFNGFSGTIPNSTVPRTEWSFGAGGITTMCFSEIVSNPVLLISSLGSPGTEVTLELSLPYVVIYDSGGMTYVNETTIVGEEGYSIVVFPGDFDCVTIYSTTPENYTNITWGLNPPLFPISIDGDPMDCDSVTLVASGGSSYSWSGGAYPSTASNTFYNSGDYFLTVTDDLGCTVQTSVAIEIDLNCFDCAGILNGTAIFDDCGECLQPTDPSFNQSCIDCAGVINGAAVIDDCGECLEPTDPNFNQSCFDCAGILYGTAVIDDCGECLEPTDLNFNETCTDCAGTLNGTAVIDYCGVCLEPTDANFNQSCAGENIVFIPNVFSPNDDGYNDYFQVYKKQDLVAQIKTYMIFSRWGELLFESRDIDFNSNMGWWNGEFKGKKMQVGVYVYYIEIEFGNGDLKQYEGDFTIVK